MVMVIILRTRSDCQYTRNNNIIYQTTVARDVSSDDRVRARRTAGRKTCARTNDRKLRIWALTVIQ